MNIIVRYCCFVFVGVSFLPSVALAVNGQSSRFLDIGYRMDSLDWNIDGGIGGPNILSELEWRDLDIFQIKAGVRSITDAGFVFRGYVDYGWVLDGVNQDSDYAGSNRTLEFSRSVNDVDGSRVWDISGGIGFAFDVGARDQWQIIPMIGYSYSNQQLRMTNGNQVVSSSANFDLYNPDPTVDVPPLGSFPGLNNRYDADWWGPWLGTDFVWSMQNNGSLFARLEAHWVNYYAQANWNLRTDFAHPISFEHEANARGSVLELGWQGALVDSRWVMGVSIVLQSWRTDSGLVRTFFVDPAPPCFGNCFSESKLNEVNWSSNSINLTLQKAFGD